MGKNKLKFDQNLFSGYAEKIDALGGDLKAIFTDALEQTGETVQLDTEDATTSANMPRGGKYSTGDTRAAIVKNPKVTWAGHTGEIPLGFDWAKKSAAGFLISGTPRMKPNRELNKIYRGKKYMNNLVNDIRDIFEDELSSRLGG